VLRPWCHFELPESDYLSEGRRAAGLPGPGGAPGPLDPSTRVVDLLSLGVRVKNSLGFKVSGT
jgi:hydrocephalus-inducing protein